MFNTHTFFTTSHQVICKFTSNSVRQSKKAGNFLTVLHGVCWLGSCYKTKNY